MVLENLWMMLSTIGLGVPGRRLSLLTTLSRVIIGRRASSLVSFAPAFASAHFWPFKYSWFPVTTKLTSLCRKLSTPFRKSKQNIYSSVSAEDICHSLTFNFFCTKYNFVNCTYVCICCELLFTLYTYL